MEREVYQDDSLIDLGAVSAETKGIAPRAEDVSGTGSPLGIADE